MPVCNLCYLGHASMCPLASCEAEQAAPCDALVPSSWQCTTLAEAVAQAFGANASKRPCLCAICTKQAMPLCVLLPTERVNRLYRAMLWCLGAGNATHTQLNVTFTLSGLVHPHSDACVQSVLPRSCVYVSPCLLRGRIGCTKRCFGA